MTFYWWLKNLTLIKPIISQAPAAGKACKKHCNITLWDKKNREQNGCGSVSRSLYPIRSRLQMPVINFQNRAFIKDFLSDAGYIYVTLTKSKPTQSDLGWVTIFNNEISKSWGQTAVFVTNICHLHGHNWPAVLTSTYVEIHEKS